MAEVVDITVSDRLEVGHTDTRLELGYADRMILTEDPNRIKVGANDSLTVAPFQSATSLNLKIPQSVVEGVASIESIRDSLLAQIGNMEIAIANAKQYIDTIENSIRTQVLTEMETSYVANNDLEAKILATDLSNMRIVTEYDSNGNPLATATLQDISDRYLNVENSFANYTSVVDGAVTNSSSAISKTEELSADVSGVKATITSGEYVAVGGFTQYTTGTPVTGQWRGAPGSYEQWRVDTWVPITDAQYSRYTQQLSIAGAKSLSTVGDAIVGWEYANGGVGDNEFKIKADKFYLESAGSTTKSAYVPFSVDAISGEINFNGKVEFSSVNNPTVRAFDTSFDNNPIKYNGTDYVLGQFTDIAVENSVWDNAYARIAVPEQGMLKVQGKSPSAYEWSLVLATERFTGTSITESGLKLGDKYELEFDFYHSFVLDNSGLGVIVKIYNTTYEGLVTDGTVGTWKKINVSGVISAEDLLYPDDMFYLRFNAAALTLMYNEEILIKNFRLRKFWNDGEFIGQLAQEAADSTRLKVWNGTYWVDTDYSKIEGVFDKGTTSINGGFISTNSIVADKIAAGEIKASHIDANAINGKTIKGAYIEGARIYGGYLEGAIITASYIDLASAKAISDYKIPYATWEALPESQQLEFIHDVNGVVVQDSDSKCMLPVSLPQKWASEVNRTSITDPAGGYGRTISGSLYVDLVSYDDYVSSNCKRRCKSIRPTMSFDHTTLVNVKHTNDKWMLIKTAIKVGDEVGVFALNQIQVISWAVYPATAFPEYQTVVVGGSTSTIADGTSYIYDYYSSSFPDLDGDGTAALRTGSGGGVVTVGGINLTVSNVPQRFISTGDWENTYSGYSVDGEFKVELPASWALPYDLTMANSTPKNFGILYTWTAAGHDANSFVVVQTVPSVTVT